MPDKGHMETEALLRALEKRIAAEYRKANREITRKVNAYMSEFKRKDKEWREKLENGDITEAEYKAWQTGQIMIGKRWEEMRHTLAQDYANTNDLAKQMAFDSMPDVYALNHNYATFEVEKGGKVDTSYTLYDRPTVERLIRDNPKLLPDPRPGSPLAQKLAKHKELRWEEQHVQSVVLQSILQGESLEQTAKRFTQLTEMNYRQSVRYARTATTGAQNAGRVDGYKRAEKLGVNMKQVWLATLDSRTRHEHRVLDGQEVDVGEPFIMDGFKIKYPGDPAAPAHLLYNCRCTVIAKVKGVDFDVSDKTQRDDKIGDMSYEEWKGEHKTAPKPPEGKTVEVKVSAPKAEKVEYVEEKIPEKPKAQYKSDIIVKNNEELGEVLENADLTFRGIPRTNPMSDWGHAMFADEGVNAYFPDDIYELEKSNRHAFFVEKNQLTAFDDVKDIISQTWEDDRRKEILSDYGFSEEQMKLKKEELLELFNPSDIVDDALGFDSLEFTTWFKERIAEEYNIDGIKTNDGAIVFNKNIIHEIVPNPEKKEVKKEKSKPKENNNSEAMQEYLEFKSKMEKKYGANLWLEMTDAEMDKLEELERKAHKGR